MPKLSDFLELEITVCRCGQMMLEIAENDRLTFFFCEDCQRLFIQGLEAKEWFIKDKEE